MPNLTAHIDIALECLAYLQLPVVERNLGPFLLGSCSPDIRIITHGRRDVTHFAPVSNQVIGAGARSMFEAYPDLADLASRSERTQAFLAGYISHLIADESWIIKIYRPYFGNRDVFEDEVVANITDRAMQLDMDRLAVDKRDGMTQARDHLAYAHTGVEVEFLDQDILAQFQGRVSDALQRQFDWGRLLFMARRQYPEEHGPAQAFAQEFVDGLPGSLEHAYSLVPRKAIAEFRATIVQEWSGTVKERLL